jgi:hypothetical protein
MIRQRAKDEDAIDFEEEDDFGNIDDIFNTI